MRVNPDDFKPDIEGEICDSCEEGVDPAEAFFEEGRFYHPSCAGVWRCSNCGKWNDKAIDVCECGEKKE